MVITQPGLTEAKLIEALQEAEQAAPHRTTGLTVRELCAMLDMPQERVRELLRPLVESGKVASSRGTRTGLHGGRSATIVYRWIAE